MKAKKILAGAFLVLLAGMTAGCGKKEIDVMENLEVEFSGVDGHGTAWLANEYGWEDAAAEAIGGKDPEDISLIGDMMKIEDAVSFELYPDEGLSNGDEVTVKATADDEKVRDYKIKFKTGEKKFTVDGLKEIEQIDLFENADVEFKGIAPYVTASVKYGGGSFPVYMSYTLDKRDGLSAGDTVTVTAVYDANQLLEKGYTAVADMKEFVVPECDSYVSKLSQIPDDIMGKMQKQIEDAISSKGWETVSGVEYIGSYFLSLKPGMREDRNNAVYMLFRIEDLDMENPEAGEKLYYYTYGRFENLILLKDGTCSVDLSRYEMPSGSAFSKSIFSGDLFWRGDYYYIGFEDIDTMFNKCVTQNIEKYEYESNVPAE